MQNRIHNHIRAVAWTAFICWSITIFVLSSTSGQTLAPYMLPLPEWDKVCHCIAFAVGAAILALALHRTTKLPLPKLIPLVIVLLSIFGATDEWHQLYTPNRSGADVFDWLADTVGATLGVLLYVGNRVKTRESTCGTAPTRD